MQFVDVKNISEILKSKNDIIITTHVNPDGDAIGSSIALAAFLRSIGKNVKVINISPTPWNLSFLDDDNYIEVFDSQKHKSELFNTELVCVLDLNDSKRLYEIGEILEKRENQTIVVDHHLNPKEFADAYWIDTDAPAVGEMVWEIINEFDEEYTKTSSDAIYVAIITDTGNFRFDRVDEQTHNIAADLLKHGSKPDELYDLVYNRVSQGAINLLGDALKGIQTYYNGKLAVMTISDEMFERNNATEDYIEGFAGQSLRINGVEAAITITEVKDRNELRVSFRSKGNVSVRELAEEFGGGGHAFAAGARIKDKVLNEARHELIENASKIFK